MCLKIFLAEGNISTCLENDYGSSPDCPGVGTQSYADGVTQPWAYSAKLSYDPVKQMKFFIGVIIEWYDRYACRDHAETCSEPVCRKWMV